jgi:hypothetical protein
MAFAADNHVVAGTGQETEGNLIGHRAAGDPQGGLLSNEGRQPVLECVDGGIFAELVVANRRRSDGGAHPWRGSGDGVGTQIDGNGKGGGRGHRFRTSEGARVASAAAPAHPGGLQRINRQLLCQKIFRTSTLVEAGSAQAAAAAGVLSDQAGHTK